MDLLRRLSSVRRPSCSWKPGHCGVQLDTIEVRIFQMEATGRGWIENCLAREGRTIGRHHRDSSDFDAF